MVSLTLTYINWPITKYLHTYAHEEEYLVLVEIPTAPSGLTEFPRVKRKGDQELDAQTSSAGRTIFQHYF